MDNFVATTGDSTDILLRSRERNGVHVQVVGLDLNPGGYAEQLAVAEKLVDFTPNLPTLRFGSLLCGYDQTNDAWVPIRVSASGSLTANVTESGTTYSTRTDIGATEIYVGEAPPGTTEGANLWRIKKVTLVGGDPTKTEWANGGAFTASWTDRATESYS
jgi:hypothetical protein